MGKLAKIAMRTIEIALELLIISLPLFTVLEKQPISLFFIPNSVHRSSIRSLNYLILYIRTLTQHHRTFLPRIRGVESADCRLREQHERRRITSQKLRTTHLTGRLSFHLPNLHHRRSFSRACANKMKAPVLVSTASMRR